MRLITQERIIELAYTNSETNEIGLIKDAQINASQLRWIQPMLGDDLWDTLDSEYPSYSVNNQILVDMLEAPLAFFCKYELVPDSSVNQTAAGLQVINTDFSTPATDRQRGEIQDSSLIHAKVLLAEVTRWIEKDANIDNYPDYLKSTNVSNKVSIRGGIVF